MADGVTGGERGGGFDAVVSNPPFQNRLRSRTALDAGVAALVRVSTGGRASAYTDASALFLDVSLGLVREGGVVAMLLPQSVLASRDAALVRAEALRAGRLEHLWSSGEHAFEGALVATCAPVIRRGAAAQGAVGRTHALGFARLADAVVGEEMRGGDGTWGALMAGARGAPVFAFESGGTIGDVAVATADFRDEYYGLAGFLAESGGEGWTRERPPVVTSGLIDLAACVWGERWTRIHKQRWLAPVLERGRLTDARMLAWLEKRLVPKVMVATQTRVLEVYADERGVVVPCMPVISVTPRDEAGLWRVAAALGSPVASAVAFERYAGTALTADAIKVAARQVAWLPIPVDAGAWERGAGLFRAAQGAGTAAERLKGVVKSGRVMCGAYGVEGDELEVLMGWWVRRIERKIKRRDGEKAE